MATALLRTRYIPLQCAWCGRAKGNDGLPVGEPLPLEAGISHGICIPCAHIEMAKVGGVVQSQVARPA